MQILGDHDINNIIRLQLSRMRAGVSEIKQHQDTGPYATRGHRIHIVLATHANVSFEVCPAQLVAHPDGSNEEAQVGDASTYYCRVQQ